MDRVILKHHHVTERRIPNAHSKQHQATAASVRLVREGAHVRALEVLCECGERLTIELSYEADGRAVGTSLAP